MIPPLRFLLAAALAAGCSRDPAGGAAPASSASASASASAPVAASSADAGGGRRGGDDEVKPVYPVTRDAPDPLAQRLCEALHALPARRKAECGGGAVGFHAGGECARMLSFALRSGAVKVAGEDVDRCAEAMGRSLEGCGWASGVLPPPAEACEGIVRGTLAEGAACRSSLECVAGLSCAGVGPTDAGKCAKPRAQGVCGAVVDALAVAVRQTRFEREHPECAGSCVKGRCGAAR